jgi:hypothetical protein
VIEALASDIDASAVGQLMRSSAWAYPVANIAHLFGLALLAGGIIAVDLRLLGMWHRLPLKLLHDALTPFAGAGLLIFAASGAAMFAADARALVGNGAFQLKLLVVAGALLNAIAFRRGTARNMGRWGKRVPLSARVGALLSLLLWGGAIILGRMIAYQ